MALCPIDTNSLPSFFSHAAPPACLPKAAFPVEFGLHDEASEIENTLIPDHNESSLSLESDDPSNTSEEEQLVVWSNAIFSCCGGEDLSSCDGSLSSTSWKAGARYDKDVSSTRISDSASFVSSVSAIAGSDPDDHETASSVGSSPADHQWRLYSINAVKCPLVRRKTNTRQGTLIMDEEQRVRADLEIEIEKELEREIKTQMMLLTRRLAGLHSLQVARYMKQQQQKQKELKSAGKAKGRKRKNAHFSTLPLKVDKNGSISDGLMSEEGTILATPKSGNGKRNGGCLHAWAASCGSIQQLEWMKTLRSGISTAPSRLISCKANKSDAEHGSLTCHKRPHHPTLARQLFASANLSSAITKRDAQSRQLVEATTHVVYSSKKNRSLIIPTTRISKVPATQTYMK